MLTRLKLENFTCFKSLDMELGPGINVLIGENGTGKTHVLKVLYAACEVSRNLEKEPSDRIFEKVFCPSGLLNRLIRNHQPKGNWRLEVRAEQSVFRMEIMDEPEKKNGKQIDSVSWNTTPDGWMQQTISSLFIPTREHLGNAPGFRSLYSQRYITFEKIYNDLLDLAYLPPLRVLDSAIQELVVKLESHMGGGVIQKGEVFYLKTKAHEFEFMLVAEGIRKLGLLWLLLQNGSIKPGTILFWDEPEANLNPLLLGTLIDVLLRLQRAGVQIFLATHEYVLLKELEFRRGPDDKILYHSFFRKNKKDGVHVVSSREYLTLQPNPIRDTYSGMLDRALGNISS